MTKGPSCIDCGTRLSLEPWAPELCPRCSLQLALEQSPVEVDLGDDPEALPTRQFPNHTFSSGQILGSRFQIRSLLGRGGMGEVWRAYDLKLRVDVALKTLRAELLEKERALAALRQEVRTAREVVSPNVCRVFDLVELDGQELVSMEYIDGTTLVTVLHSRGPLELQEAREIASQFLAGLEAIHQSGLIHRDLKPENVMITRSGRVVVMDFGIAKGLADRKTGTVSGTPAYMAPEQARGQEVNARADVFSAGVVLAEMIAPEGIKSPKAREAIWQGIHHEPPELPDTPWAAVLRKAVARIAEQRYPSAAALARALEEVTLQVDGAEDVRPYPGLASFAEEDAEYFFGRELEVEAMWKKLRRPHLLGLVGPSGAGKSSFLRAGLLSVMPEGWRAVVTTPGSRPFTNLARVLVHELASDTHVTEQFIRFEEVDVAISLFRSWRQQFEHGLVIVDQFEELFTLNSPDVQERFSELLGRLSIEADVHVLLSMRDDFLYHCHAYEPLRPLLSELTLMGPPTGAALRRAVVQPALKCGYRFEDEALVEEILSEVEDERGALPMVAFAASRLWDHRDRERGLLTKEAYEHIGGVGGALAQHAEATLEKIGNDRIPIVREIFRNLVTSQGTRAARDMDELLSVFEDQDAAEEVLRALIDARLLTSFEVTADEDEEKGHHRVEIIHESLLSAWPRLVRWQTQDQEGAQLRDELRQAAQLWEQHNHSTDRLWTGTAVKEFQIWRERYSGGLTTTEEAFAHAILQHAERRKRRRRAAVVAALVVAFGIAALTGTLWQRSVTEARRAEAAQLRALGQLELEERPSAAIAYALASLELNDNPEVRRFALKALWKGPTELWINEDNYSGVDFSPDGRWLALGHGGDADIHVFPISGGEPLVLKGQGPHPSVQFFPGSDHLLSCQFALEMWSIPEGRRIQKMETPGRGRLRQCFPLEDRTVFATFKEGGLSIYSLSNMWEPPSLLGRLPGQEFLGSRGDGKAWVPHSVDPSGTWFAHAYGSTVYVSPLNDLEKSRPVGRHDEPVRSVTFSSDGENLASVDVSGEIRTWSRTEVDRNPLRIIETGDENLLRVKFDAAGSRLVTEATTGGVTSIWDLTGPPDAEPLFLERRPAGFVFFSDFHPDGRWAAIRRVAYPLDRPYPKILRGHGGLITGLVFAPDSSWLASSSLDGELIQWPLSPEAGAHHRVLLDRTYLSQLAVDPLGRFLVAAPERVSAEPIVVDLKDGSSRSLEVKRGFEYNKATGASFRVAVGPRGRRVAADFNFVPLEGADVTDPGGTVTTNAAARRFIQVWDLETGAVQVLETGIPERVSMLQFTADGRLLSAFFNGDVRFWNVDEGTYEVLLEKSADWFYMTQDERTLVGILNVSRATVYDLENGSRRELSSHGDRLGELALDPTGRIVLTGDRDGIIRVGPITGEEPHLLLGHEGAVIWIKVSPKGDWIASGGVDHTVRLWPMPDVDKQPFHTLPYEEFLDRLRGLTNLRAVPHEESSTGYRIDIGPFPGFGKVPEW